MNENIKIAVDGCELFGTLAQAKNRPAKALAIIHAGSGPTDRNGNSSNGLNTDCLKLLSSALSDNGIATLRFDKRGVGESVAGITTESGLVLEDYVRDLRAWIGHLAREYDVPLFLIGHSEGALICSIAALDCNRVEGLTTICATSRYAQDLLLEQIEAKYPELIEPARAILQNIENGEMTDRIPTELSEIFRPSVFNYLNSWFKFDPCEIIQRISIPTLVISGSEDIQVPSNDAVRLAEHSIGAEYVEIENMGHTLKCPNGDERDVQSEYTDPNLPIALELVQSICRFVECSVHET